MQREIDELERICITLHHWLGQTSFDLDRRQLVELRRQLTEQMIAVGRGATDFLNGCQPGDAAKFRERLSSLRAWAAAHQTAWPAIRIEPERAADYRRSAAVVGAAATDLITLARLLAARAAPASIQA